MSIVRSVHRGRQSSWWRLLSSRLLVWGGAMILVGLAPTAVSDVGQVTRFQRTVEYLADAAPELRSDFAATALSSLASAYVAEARLAREDARRAGRGSHLWAWSARVDHYASQMPLLLDDIALGFPVRLTLEGEKSLAIMVGDRTVILSHPRLYEQGAFEQAILAAFCARHSCKQFSPQSAAVPIPVSTVQIRPNWTFTAQKWFCTYRGITVRFNSEQNMANSRLICEQLMQEVMTLTDELAWQQRQAVVIEWDQLALQATPHRPEHMLQLNAGGDTVLVTVPMLYRSAALFGQVLPWIRERASGQEGVSVDLDADHYGWQEP